MSGKGSAPRPIPDRDTFSTNFDAIFRNVKDKPTEVILESTANGVGNEFHRLKKEASSAEASSKGDSNENKDT
jgi:hypothetical protein|tara:strand:- start:4633 stop:4851 length:219 start_codon:yes stop_codon:yes gene_type:complete